LSKIMCEALAKDDELFMGVGVRWGRIAEIDKGWAFSGPR
jgi:hypothetical protein